MLDNSGTSLSEVASAELDWPWGEGGAALRGRPGSGSGGFADHVFLHAAEQLFGDTNVPLVYKNLR